MPRANVSLEDDESSQIDDDKWPLPFLTFIVEHQMRGRVQYQCKSTNGNQLAEDCMKLDSV